MKKVLLSFAGLLVMATVVVLFINAKGNPEDVKAKAADSKVESKAPAMTGCGACPSMAAASCATAEKKVTASAAKVCTNPDCKDPDCKGECKTAEGTAKACDPAACPGMKGSEGTQK